MGEGSGLTLGDALALQDRNRNYDDGMFGGNGSWCFFLFFLLAWGNGGFFGGRNMGAAMEGALTRSDLCSEFNFNTLDRRTEGIANGLCDSTFALNNSLKDGFYGTERSLCAGFNNIGNLIQQSRFDAKECCCETNRNIDSVRYQMERTSCDIMQNNDRNTQRIIDHMTANEMQGLRDELQTARMQLSQQAQSANLIAELRPCAKPAYITCSPYEAAYGARGYYGGRGYYDDCGCGCR